MSCSGAGGSEHSGHDQREEEQGTRLLPELAQEQDTQVRVGKLGLCLMVLSGRAIGVAVHLLAFIFSRSRGRAGRCQGYAIVLWGLFCCMFYHK